MPAKKKKKKVDPKKQVARPKPKAKQSHELGDLLVEVLKEDRGLNMDELVALVQSKLQLDPHWTEATDITSINEGGISSVLTGDKRFEVTEGSRWRLKGD